MKQPCSLFSIPKRRRGKKGAGVAEAAVGGVEYMVFEKKKREK